MKLLSLELLIALGGIATGIGAIWTAVVTRILVRTTERNLAEQSQSLREQNERARITLEIDLLHEMRERFLSPLYRNFRQRSLTYVKENYFTNDGLLDVQELDPATEAVHNLMDEAGYLCGAGVLSVERVYAFLPAIKHAWVLWEPAVKKLREERGDPHWYGHFEYLYHQIVDLECQRGGTGERPTKEELREFVEDNLEYAEIENPAAVDEEPGKS